MFQEENEKEIIEKNYSKEILEKENNITNLGKFSNDDLNSNFSKIENIFKIKKINFYFIFNNKKNYFRNYKINKKNKDLFNYIKKLSDEFNLPSPNENNNFSNDFEEEIELTLENKEKLSKIFKNISLCLNFNSNN